jgi:hypothetical protein
MAATERSTAIGYANVNGLLTVCSCRSDKKALETQPTVGFRLSTATQISGLPINAMPSAMPRTLFGERRHTDVQRLLTSPRTQKEVAQPFGHGEYPTSTC